MVREAALVDDVRVDAFDLRELEEGEEGPGADAGTGRFTGADEDAE